MVGVVKGHRQRIAKYSRRFLERNPMLSAILSVFTRVPFKIHRFILTRHRRLSNNSESERDCSQKSGKCCEQAQELVTKIASFGKSLHRSRIRESRACLYASVWIFE